MTQSILVVDDNPQIRGMVRGALELEDGNPYEVHEAENGEEAIEVLTEQDIDLVILDLWMPVTDGWETLRVIRDRENGWPEMKVIMLTVQKGAENALKAWTIGADHYLSKPVRIATLMETVDKALSNSDEPVGTFEEFSEEVS